MYLVIRCPGCRTFMYIDHLQRWRLCPSCGESINCTRAPVYIEVRDHHDAESIAEQLEKHLHRSGKKDLTLSELEQLRFRYAEWIRARES
jgi:acetyl-CoA carboxylase beta subunit